MIDLNFKYKELIEQLRSEISEEPYLAIVLGSGLGDFVKNVKLIKSYSTSGLPGYPPSTIQSHEGKIHFAEFSGKRLLIFQGRIHFYEGYPLWQCILPEFISYKLGSKKILLTNAAGGINPMLEPGDLMLAASFNGISIKKELTDLIGLASIEEKKYFYDFPSSSFNENIKQAALTEKIYLHEGVYWYTKGPSYDTPAEIKMIKKFGGDAIGMSTVHEAVFAGYLGMETSSISCITNYAAGISGKKLDHQEVTETANRVKDKFERLVKGIISSI